MNDMSKIIRSERGQSLLLAAFTVGLLSIGAITYMQSLSDTQLRTYSKYKVMLEGQNVMRNFGTVVQRAYDIWLVNNKSCPADLRDVNPAGSSVHFCMPTKENSCFGDFCLDTKASDFVAYLNPDAPPSPLDGLKPKTWWHEARTVAVNYIQSSNNAAYAQRVTQRPQPPAAGTISNDLTPPSCPGDILCRRCSGSDLSCVTLKICSKRSGTCSADEYWTQRFGLREQDPPKTTTNVLVLSPSIPVVETYQYTSHKYDSGERYPKCPGKKVGDSCRTLGWCIEDDQWIVTGMGTGWIRQSCLLCAEKP